MLFPITTTLVLAVTLAANTAPTPRSSSPAKQAPAAAGQPSGQSGGSDIFKRVDTNGNSSIDQKEWQAFQQSRFERLDANHNGTLAGAEMDQSSGGGRLTRLDSNGDGAISSQEFVSGQLQAMKRLDKNQDGVLSRDEFAAGRS